jgi:hypothetical protein
MYDRYMDIYLILGILVDPSDKVAKGQYERYL